MTIRAVSQLGGYAVGSGLFSDKAKVSLKRRCKCSGLNNVSSLSEMFWYWRGKLVQNSCGFGQSNSIVYAKLAAFMLKIGMTGGIGSGKTTVGLLFQANGIPLIDADQIAHQQAKPGQSAYQAIVDHFGSQCLNADNTLNRVWLRHCIFNSATDKQALENITHPLIFNTISTWFKQQTASYCIASIPLLVEYQ